jgi:hypothetical protein
LAHMPVEIVDIGEVPTTPLTHAISLANSLQTEFFFDRLAQPDAANFRMHSYTEVYAPKFLSSMELLRRTIKGYLELSPILRQTVKTQNPFKGE